MWLQAGMALASLGVGLLNKPKKKDFTPNTSYLDKYVANLRGDLAARRVERNILREGSRAVGDMAREGLESVEYQAHRTGTVGSGLQIAQQQKVQQQAQSTMAEVTRAAKEATAEQSAIAEREIAQIEMKREQIETQAREDYRRAKGAWGRDMIGRGIQGAVSVGGAAIQSAMAWKDASAVASAQGVTGEGGVPLTGRALKEMTGTSTPSAAMQVLGITQDRQRGYTFVKDMVETLGIASSPAIQAIMSRIDSGELTAQQGMQLIETTEEAKYNLKSQEIVGKLTDSGEPMEWRDIYKAYSEAGFNHQQATQGADNILKATPNILGIVAEEQQEIDDLTYANLILNIDQGSAGITDITKARESGNINDTQFKTLIDRQMSREKQASKETSVKVTTERDARQTVDNLSDRMYFYGSLAKEGSTVHQNLAKAIEQYDYTEEGKTKIRPLIRQFVSEIPADRMEQVSDLYAFAMSQMSEDERARFESKAEFESLSDVEKRIRLSDAILRGLPIVNKDKVKYNAFDTDFNQFGGQ